MLGFEVAQSTVSTWQDSGCIIPEHREAPR
jgi:hypothetical protein